MWVFVGERGRADEGRCDGNGAREVSSTGTGLARVHICIERWGGIIEPYKSIYLKPNANAHHRIATKTMINTHRIQKNKNSAEPTHQLRS